MLVMVTLSSIRHLHEVLSGLEEEKVSHVLVVCQFVHGSIHALVV